MRNGIMHFMLCAALTIISAEASAWQPTGSLRELYDDALLLRARPGVKAASFSSYDRTGGNNDGFSGAYSKLREEDGNSVIAEMEGPGCIQRLWMTHSSGEEDGLLERKGEHIRIYLDGSDVPALDAPLEHLFDNSLEHFPYPLAGHGIGGFYSYIPIPYRKSCKVVVEGLGVRFYQLNYATYPSDDGVNTFQMELTDEEREMLRKAAARWSDPLGQLRETEARTAVIPLKHQPGGSEPILFEHVLKSGSPMLVHGMVFEGIDEAFIAASRIEIACNDPKAVSISLPLAFFLGQAFDSGPFSSLFFGREGEAWYNRLPFVYSGSATVRLHSILPAEGVLTVYESPLGEPAEEFGVLTAQCHESLPALPDVYHPLLQTEGKGHLAGLYLVTEGPSGLPYWLEGDDRFTIDGELRIHGTGTEDYFNCGWYALDGRLNGPDARPSHGFPVYGLADNTMRAAAFRWHYSDVVPFDRSMDFVIEHGEANRHVANYRSVAFWYAH